MIHLYHGYGKGKTTAACGLAIRAVGSGMRVLFVQFFKDGSSSEISVLSQLPGVTVLIPPVYYGRFKTMSEEEREEIRRCYGDTLKKIAESAGDYGLIVLDEAVSAYGYGMLDQAALLQLLKNEGGVRELVLTGRDPAPELKECADYVTDMRKEKHPYDRGILARKGIEF